MKIHLSRRQINYSEWSLGPLWLLLISSAPCWCGHRTSWLLPFPHWLHYPAHGKGGIHVSSVIYTNSYYLQLVKNLLDCPSGAHPLLTSLMGVRSHELQGATRQKTGRTTKSSVTICECLRLLPYSFLKSIIHSLMLMDPFLWLPSCWPAETQW